MSQAFDTKFAPAFLTIPLRPLFYPPRQGDNFMTKVFAAAAQGCTAALVAAILSAMCEPLVNRLCLGLFKVKGMSRQAAESRRRSA